MKDIYTNHILYASNSSAEAPTAILPSATTFDRISRDASKDQLVNSSIGREQSFADASTNTMSSGISTDQTSTGYNPNDDNGAAEQGAVFIGGFWGPLIAFTLIYVLFRINKKIR
ncbi:MAG: hypothetical protein ACK5MK_08075 [Dysgonomonas sp.]